MPISKWNGLVSGLEVWNELEDVQWSRPSGGTQWRFPVRSFSKPHSGISKSVHPIIRYKMLLSLRGKKSSDRFLLLLLSVSSQGKRTSFHTKEMTKCTWQVWTQLHEGFEQFTEKRKNGNITATPIPFTKPHSKLVWLLLLERSSWSCKIQARRLPAGLRAGVCPGSANPRPVTETQNPPVTNF